MTACRFKVGDEVHINGPMRSRSPEDALGTVTTVGRKYVTVTGRYNRIYRFNFDGRAADGYARDYGYRIVLADEHREQQVLDARRSAAAATLAEHGLTIERQCDLDIDTLEDLAHRLMRVSVPSTLDGYRKFLETFRSDRHPSGYAFMRQKTTADRIFAIRELRTAFNLSLTDAKHIVDRIAAGTER